MVQNCLSQRFQTGEREKKTPQQKNAPQENPKPNCLELYPPVNKNGWLGLQLFLQPYHTEIPIETKPSRQILWAHYSVTGVFLVSLVSSDWNLSCGTLQLQSHPFLWSSNALFNHDTSLWICAAFSSLSLILSINPPSYFLLHSYAGLIFPAT